MVALTKAAKEGYKGRMLQHNANTTIKGPWVQARRKWEDSFSPELSIFGRASIKSTKDKHGSYSCYRRDRMQLPAPAGNYTQQFKNSASYLSFCKYENVSKQMRVNKRPREMGLNSEISLYNRHNTKKPQRSIWVQILHLLCWEQNCYTTGKQSGIQLQN